jgi:uncharacterized delta-60 repeat protein
MLSATRLAFATGATSVAVDATLAPLTVDVEDAGGNVVAGDTSVVSLTVDTGPDAGTLSGTLTVQAVGGVATFSDLSFDTAGVYTVTATDGTLAAATSATIAVTAPVVTKTIGNLDPTFGTGGLASHDVGFSSVIGLANDGTQSVLVGTVGTAPDESFGITRFNADGSLDTSFGTNGVTTNSFNALDSIPTDVAVLPDGGIVIAGTAYTYSEGGTVAGSQFAVAEYNPDGSLDTSFGSTGAILLNFAGGGLSFDVLRALAVGSNGIIYVGGSSDADSDDTDFAIAALTSSGTLDTSFGGGTALVDIDGGDDAINALAVQSNGDVVAAGQAVAGSATEVAVARFLPSGALDPHFGNKGVATAAVGGVYDAAMSVAVQPKGQIVFGGLTVSGSGSAIASSFLVGRFSATGKLDRTFGGGGFVVTPFGQTAAVTAVVVLPTGSIVASGRTAATLGGTINVAIARYTTGGALDTSFNHTGSVVIDLGGGGVVGSSDQRLAPAIDLPSAFDAFDASRQGVVALTQGGEILTAGNSDADTVEAELVAAGIDLVARVLSNLPTSVLAGARATVSMTISESGTTLASGTVTVEVQFAVDTVGTAATTAKSFTEKVKLKQGQTAPYHLPFVYPTGLTPGSYYLLATVVNGANLPADLNPTNNTAATTGTVTIAPATASLVGSALAAIGSVRAGGPLSFTITLDNIGNVTAKGSTTVDLYLSTDLTTADGTPLAPVTMAVALPPGKSKAIRLKAILPSTVTAGQYDLLAIVDPGRALGPTDQTASAVVFDADPVAVS